MNFIYTVQYSDGSRKNFDELTEDEQKRLRAAWTEDMCRVASECVARQRGQSRGNVKMEG